MQNIMKINCLIVVCFLAVSSVAAQTADKKAFKDLFEKIKKIYDTENDFYVTSDYKTFSSHSSKTAIESYKGLFVKNGDQTYTKVANAEFILFGKHFLQIDNDSKLMEYRKIDVKKEIALFDFMRFIDKFAGFSIENKDGVTVCTMTADKISTVPYSKIEIFIDNKTNTITKQVLYLLISTSYTDSNGKSKADYPRIEIIFSGLETRDIQKYTPKFSLASYFKVDHGKYIMSNEYKGYSVID
jgi:hypothetical protein